VAQEDHIPNHHHHLEESAVLAVEETEHISQEVKLVLLLVEETLAVVAVAVAEQLRPLGLTRYELALVAVQEL
jgi:hypothetical protein